MDGGINPYDSDRGSTSNDHPSGTTTSTLDTLIEPAEFWVNVIVTGPLTSPFSTVYVPLLHPNPSGETSLYPAEFLARSAVELADKLKFGLYSTLTTLSLVSVTRIR